MPRRRSLTQMGTEKESFIQLTERINRTTGGVSVYPFVTAVKGSPDPVAFLMVGHRTSHDICAVVCHQVVV